MDTEFDQYAAFTDICKLHQWCVWKLEPTTNGKLSKPPYSPDTGRKVSKTDEAALVSFERAYHAWQHGHALDREPYSGIGFVVYKKNGMVWIDLDGVIDEHGVIAEWVQPWIEKFSSFTYITPSGTGLRIVVYATLPFDEKRAGTKVNLPESYRLPGIEKTPAIEVYDNNSMLCVTCNHLPGTSEAIEPRQQVVDELLVFMYELKGTVEPMHSDAVEQTTKEAPTRTQPSHRTDDDWIIERLRTGGIGDHFVRLFDKGDIDLHNGDDSIADYTLCNMLAYWTQDEAQLDRIFRRSKLMREKWDRPQSGSTYGAIEVRNAIARRAEHDRQKEYEESNFSLIDACLLISNAQKTDVRTVLHEVASLIPAILAEGGITRDEAYNTLALAALKRGVLLAEAYALLESTPKMSSNQEPLSNEDMVEKALTYDASDDGNAETVRLLYGNLFVYTSSLGWLWWSGTHWVEDKEEARITRYVTKTLRWRRSKAIKASGSNNEKIVACTLTNVGRINACKTLLKSKLAVQIEEFDLEPDCINCLNGVLHFPTLTVTPHDSSQRYTYCIPHVYDPAIATFPWEKFIKGTLAGGDEVYNVFHMFMGYSITGRMDEEKMVYLCGKQRSGKGTLTQGIHKCVNAAIVASVSPAVITRKRSNDASNFELAPLRPARLVITYEGERHGQLDASLVKAITGREIIHCCFKMKTHFSYAPQFKIVYVSNFELKLDVEDAAAWDRMLVFNFADSHPDGTEDKSIKATLHSPEMLTALFCWLVQGAHKWYAEGAQGLVIPQAVKDLRNEHKYESDYVAQWLDTAMVRMYIDEGKIDTRAYVPNASIKRSYHQFCDDIGLERQYRLSPKALSSSLANRGFNIGKQRSVRPTPPAVNAHREFILGQARCVEGLLLKEDVVLFNKAIAEEKEYIPIMPEASAQEVTLKGRHSVE